MTRLQKDIEAIVAIILSTVEYTLYVVAVALIIWETWWLLEKLSGVELSLAMIAVYFFNFITFAQIAVTFLLIGRSMNKTKTKELEELWKDPISMVAVGSFIFSIAYIKLLNMNVWLPEQVGVLLVVDIMVMLAASVVILVVCWNK